MERDSRGLVYAETSGCGALLAARPEDIDARSSVVRPHHMIDDNGPAVGELGLPIHSREGWDESFQKEYFSVIRFGD